MASSACGSRWDWSSLSVGVGGIGEDCVWEWVEKCICHDLLCPPFVLIYCGSRLLFANPFYHSTNACVPEYVGDRYNNKSSNSSLRSHCVTHSKESIIGIKPTDDNKQHLRCHKRQLPNYVFTPSA